MTVICCLSVLHHTYFSLWNGTEKICVRLTHSADVRIKHKINSLFQHVREFESKSQQIFNYTTQNTGIQTLLELSQCADGTLCFAFPAQVVSSAGPHACTKKRVCLDTLHDILVVLMQHILNQWAYQCSTTLQKSNDF